MRVNGVSIYSSEYGPWDETAKRLNASKGEESIRMAEEQGIELSDEQKQGVIAVTNGGTLNKMAIILKLAQTMEAVKYPRWSRGEKKEPAKDIFEITAILEEELDLMLEGQTIDEQTKKQIRTSMLESAKTTYVAQRRNSIRRKVIGINWNDAKMMQEMGIEYIVPEIMDLPRLDDILQQVPEGQIDQIYYEIDEIMGASDTLSKYQMEKLICEKLRGWEEKYAKKQNGEPNIN